MIRRQKDSATSGVSQATTVDQMSPPLTVSALASLALMGDTLLYAVLPTEAASLGIPLLYVGILLSVNRFVRLVTNAWAASIYEKYGGYWPFMVAMIVASWTTVAYGLHAGVWPFLIARVMWGTCWSFINLGMYLSVLQHKSEDERGRWMGNTKSISRIGTIIGLSVGGLLTDQIGFRAVVFAFGSVAFVGTIIAMSVRRWRGRERTIATADKTVLSDASDRPRPARDELHLEPSESRRSDPDHLGHAEADPILTSSRRAQVTYKHVGLIYGMGFVFGFVVHGVIAGTLSLLVLERFEQTVSVVGMTIGVATLSGFLLALRWIAEIVFAPAAGVLGDKIGAARVVAVATVVQSGLLVLLTMKKGLGALVAISTLLFLGGVVISVCLDAVAGTAGMRRRRVSEFMGRYVTAQDFGAALGPFIGYLVGVGVGLGGLYVGAAVLAFTVAMMFARKGTVL